MMAERPKADLETAAERLARSRAELQHLFEPEATSESVAGEGEPRSAFPRSAIMRAITKNGGKTGLALLAVALFAAKPRLAMRLLRYLPVSAITKTLIAQFAETRHAKR